MSVRACAVTLQICIHVQNTAGRLGFVHRGFVHLVLLNKQSITVISFYWYHNIQISYRLSHATRSSCPAIDTQVADLRLLHMLRCCELLPPCLPFLQKKYGDEHRLFVQAMLSASVLSEIEAEETFKRCFHSANVEGKSAKQSFFSSRLLSLWFAFQHTAHYGGTVGASKGECDVKFFEYYCISTATYKFNQNLLHPVTAS